MIQLFKPLFNLISLLLKVTPEQGQRSLLIQPLPGIGDMVWHLPHIHSLAAVSEQGRLSILTKPRSRADVLLAGDPCVDKILWLERNPGRHDGLGGFFRLVSDLRKEAFHNVWILHDSHRYAWAAFLAGIPERRGYGQGIQQLLLSQPLQLDPALLKSHPIQCGDLLLEGYQIKKLEQEPVLPVYEPARQRIRSSYAEVAKPWVAIGIGSSEPFKQWGDTRFGELVIAIGKQFGHSLVLIGGPGEQGMADNIIAAAESAGVQIHPAIGLPIDDTAAILADSELYIGNDTGFLNMAAALAVPSIGLFGGSPPLTHSKNLYCLQPEDSSAGMQGISANWVIQQAQQLKLL